MEQLLAQFHMVCVLFSNICTLLHSKIHTATAWVATLSFRWIKLFFFPYSRFFFFTQVSETISFWLRSRQPTGNCTSWGAKEKKKKKSFRTLSLLLRRHGTQHAGRGSKSSYFGIWHSLLSMFRMEVFTFDRSLTYSFLHFICFCFASAGMEHNLVIDLNRPILASDTLCWVCSGWKFLLLTGHLHTHFCIFFVFVLLLPAWSTTW